MVYALCADVEEDLIDSDFTSIQQRSFDYVKSKSRKNKPEKRVVERVNHLQETKAVLLPKPLLKAQLMLFFGSSSVSLYHTLLFTRDDYFELLGSTGRLIREDKCGCIQEKTLPMLERLGKGISAAARICQ